jgi:hypothetical protein
LHLTKNIHPNQIIIIFTKIEKSLAMTTFGFPQKFDKNVSFVIATFLTPKQYKFLDWIDQTKLDWENLSGWVDESILKKNSYKIKWEHIPSNENAPSLVYDLFENRNGVYQKVEHRLLQERNYFKTIRKHKESISNNLWKSLNSNSSNVAINLLLKYSDKISWDFLSENTNPIAIFMLSQNQEEINWETLCFNFAAIPILKEKTKDFTINLDLINWENLSSNQSAIDILKTNPQFINWCELTSNPAAMDMILNPQNIEKNWHNLSLNSSAIDYLKNNQHHIDYERLSWNEAIIEPDMKQYNLIVSSYTKMIYHL